jgi:integrase
VPKLRHSLPSYSLHKRSGQAVVRLAGRDVYLGPLGSPESRELYDRFVAEWLANHRRPPAPPAEAPPDVGVTVDELIVRYLEFARLHYRKDHARTSEFGNVKDALRPLHRLFGSTPAAAFGPKRLKAVRDEMVRSGSAARTTVNARVRRIVRAFRWAGSEELIPAAVHQALKTVSGLQRGRTSAREPGPVKPVPEAFVDAVRPHVARQVWAMVELQRLSGMRPGEVVSMRTGDLDTSGRVWLYRPRGHKTEHTGRERLVYLGPRAQEVLRPWLRTDLDEYLFQPREAEAERQAERRRDRKSKVSPSQVDRSKPGARRKPGDHYPPLSYYVAVRRACEAAGVPRWCPNRLRHNAATALRREFGLDVAQVVLGHASPDTTLIYAEADRQRAAEAMLRIG